MTHPILLTFDKTRLPLHLQGDGPEKLSNTLLKPLQLIGGETIRVEKIGESHVFIPLPRQTRSNEKIVGIALFCLLLPLTGPSVISGIVCRYHSKSYFQSLEEHLHPLSPPSSYTPPEQYSWLEGFYWGKTVAKEGSDDLIKFGLEHFPIDVFVTNCPDRFAGQVAMSLWPNIELYQQVLDECYVDGGKITIQLKKSSLESAWNKLKESRENQKDKEPLLSS